MAKAKKGKRYRHYKGREYIVRAIARHSETLEEFVVYEGQYCDSEFGNNPTWARPKKMFEEKIKYNGEIIDRFAEIS